MASESPQARRGLVDRILGAWSGPRREMRRLLADRPSEATLLSFLMIVALLGFTGRYVEHASQPWDPNEPSFVAAWESSYRAAGADASAAGGGDPSALSAAERGKALAAAMEDKLARDRLEMAIGSFLVFPLSLYLLAAASHPVLRASGGSGEGYETRAAFVWASVVTAPIGLGAALLIVFGDPADWAQQTVRVAVLAAWLFFIASSLAEAHRFRSAASILGGLIAAVVAVGAVFFAARSAFL